jgi:hypothetical protein
LNRLRFDAIRTNSFLILQREMTEELNRRR